MVEDILDEGDVKRKSKHFDGEEERVTKKMRVVEDEDEDEDEIERKEKQEQEEEEEEEKREAKVMKVEEEEEDKEEKVNALLSSPSLSPPTEVDCASSPPRMSLNIMDNNNNSDASTSSDMRQVPSRIETGILSKVPPELLRHILKFLSPEVIFAVNYFLALSKVLVKIYTFEIKRTDRVQRARAIYGFDVHFCFDFLLS